MSKRLLKRIWNVVSGCDMSQEEYDSNMKEFIAMRGSLIDVINPMFATWNNEWDKKNSHKILRKGTFEYRCYGRFIAEKMDYCAETINKNYRKGNVELGVYEREGEPVIFGKVKDRPKCVLEVPWYA